MVLNIFSRRKTPPTQLSHSSPLRPSLSLPNLRSSLLGDGEGEGLIWVGDGDTDSGFIDIAKFYPGRYERETGLEGDGMGLAVSTIGDQFNTPIKQKMRIGVDSSGDGNGRNVVGDGSGSPVAGSGGRVPIVSGTPPQYHRPFSPSIASASSPAINGGGLGGGSLVVGSGRNAQGRILDFRVPHTLRSEDLRPVSSREQGQDWKSVGGVGGGGGGGGGGMGVMNRSYPVSTGSRSGMENGSGARGGTSKNRMRGKKTMALDLNVVVVGRKGVGKSSFANLLLTAPEHPEITRHLEIISIQLDLTIHERHEPGSRGIVNPKSDPVVLDSAAPTIEPPKADVQDDELLMSFSVDPKGTKYFSALNRTLVVSTSPPPHPSVGGGSVARSRPSSIGRSPNRNRSSFASMRMDFDAFGTGSWKEQKVCLNVIDTPGLVFEEGRELELERHVRGLIRISEERLAETLREESKVTRRGLGMSDRLIHLVIYLIDPSTILEPPIVSVWLDSFPPVIGAASKEGVIFDFPSTEPDGSPRISVGKNAAQNSTWKPSLRKDELRAIGRLSKRSNVLPIVTRADTLTTAQRHTVQEALRRDLGAADLGWGGFDMVDRGQTNADSASSGGDSREDEVGSEQDANSGGIGGNGEIEDQHRTTGILPFFLFSPEVSPDSNASGMPPGPPDVSFTRTYPWGAIDALDPSHSDFAKFYSNMLGPLLMSLKGDARDNLYEQYRTERLLAARQAQASGAL